MTSGIFASERSPGLANYGKYKHTLLEYAKAGDHEAKRVLMVLGNLERRHVHGDQSVTDNELRLSNELSRLINPNWTSQTDGEMLSPQNLDNVVRRLTIKIAEKHNGQTSGDHSSWWSRALSNPLKTVGNILGGAWKALGQMLWNETDPNTGETHFSPTKLITQGLLFGALGLGMAVATAVLSAPAMAAVSIGLLVMGGVSVYNEAKELLTMEHSHDGVIGEKIGSIALNSIFLFMGGGQLKNALNIAAAGKASQAGQAYEAARSVIRFCGNGGKMVSPEQLAGMGRMGRAWQLIKGSYHYYRGTYREAFLHCDESQAMIRQFAHSSVTFKTNAAGQIGQKAAVKGLHQSASAFAKEGIIAESAESASAAGDATGKAKTHIHDRAKKRADFIERQRAFQAELKAAQADVTNAQKALARAIEAELNAATSRLTKPTSGSLFDEYQTFLTEARKADSNAAYAEFLSTRAGHTLVKNKELMALDSTAQQVAGLLETEMSYSMVKLDHSGVLPTNLNGNPGTEAVANANARMKQLRKDEIKAIRRQKKAEKAKQDADDRVAKLEAEQVAKELGNNGIDAKTVDVVTRWRNWFGNLFGRRQDPQGHMVYSANNPRGMVLKRGQRYTMRTTAGADGTQGTLSVSNNGQLILDGKPVTQRINTVYDSAGVATSEVTFVETQLRWGVPKGQGKGFKSYGGSDELQMVRQGDELVLVKKVIDSRKVGKKTVKTERFEVVQTLAPGEKMKLRVYVEKVDPKTGNITGGYKTVHVKHKHNGDLSFDRGYLSSETIAAEHFQSMENVVAMSQARANATKAAASVKKANTLVGKMSAKKASHPEFGSISEAMKEARKLEQTVDALNDARVLEVSGKAATSSSTASGMPTFSGSAAHIDAALTAEVTGNNLAGSGFAIDMTTGMLGKPTKPWYYGPFGSPTRVKAVWQGTEVVLGGKTYTTVGNGMVKCSSTGMIYRIHPTGSSSGVGHTFDLKPIINELRFTGPTSGGVPSLAADVKVVIQGGQHFLTDGAGNWIGKVDDLLKAGGTFSINGKTVALKSTKHGLTVCGETLPNSCLYTPPGGSGSVIPTPTPSGDGFGTTVSNWFLTNSATGFFRAFGGIPGKFRTLEAAKGTRESVAEDDHHKLIHQVQVIRETYEATYGPGGPGGPGGNPNGGNPNFIGMNDFGMPSNYAQARLGR